MKKLKNIQIEIADIKKKILNEKEKPEPNEKLIEVYEKTIDSLKNDFMEAQKRLY